MALSVADIEITADWYERHFDMQTIVSAERPPPDGEVRLLRAGNLIVELQQRQDAIDRHAAEAGFRAAHRTTGIFKSGLIVADIDAVFAALQSSGADIVHPIVRTPDALGLRTFAVRDPEGNMIQIFGD